MLLQKKIDRAFKWLKDKNKAKTCDDNPDKIESNESVEKIEEENVELEKNDFLAMFISSFIVFLPIIIILLIIALWAFL